MAVANYERRLRDLRREGRSVEGRLRTLRKSVNDHIVQEVAKISSDLAKATAVADDVAVRANSAVVQRDEAANRLGDLSREFETVNREAYSYTKRRSALELVRAKNLQEEDARLRREVAAAEEAVRRDFVQRVQPVLDRVRHYLANQRRLDEANQFLAMYQACAKCVERLRTEWGVEIPSDYVADLTLDIADAQREVDAIPIVELDDVDLDIGLLDQHGTNALVISPQDASGLRDRTGDDP